MGQAPNKEHISIIRKVSKEINNVVISYRYCLEKVCKNYDEDFTNHCSENQTLLAMCYDFEEKEEVVR